MKFHHLCIVAIVSPILPLTASAQEPPAAPPPALVGAAVPSAPIAQQAGSLAARNSTVSAVVYGPQGEVQALTLHDGVAVSLTPDLGIRLQAIVTRGTRVRVVGTERLIAGQTSLVAQSLAVKGQTFTAAALPPDGGAAPGGAIPAPPPPGPCGPRGGSGPVGVPPPPPAPIGVQGPPLPPNPVGGPMTSPTNGPARPPAPAGATPPASVPTPPSQ